MSFTQRIGQVRYLFPDLKSLLAKASPLRSGDLLAGVAAASEEERVAARFALADVPLARLLDDPVVPYATALRLYSLVPPDVHREMFTFAKGYHNDLAQYGRFKRALRRILTEPPPGEGVKPS